MTQRLSVNSSPSFPPSNDELLATLVKEAKKLHAQLDSLLGQYEQRDALLQKQLHLLTRSLALQVYANQPIQNTLLDALSEQLKEYEAAIATEIMALEAQIEQLTISIHTTQQQIDAPPLASVEEKPAHPTASQQATLEFICRWHQLTSADSVIQFTDSSTGVAKRSAIHFFEVLHQPHPPLRLIAKFDELDRAEQEWHSVAQVRQLGLPANIILPHKDSHYANGVMIYPEARTGAVAGSQRFSNYILSNLKSCPQDCAKGLHDAIQLLHSFHSIQPGTWQCENANRSPLTWFDVLPKSWVFFRTALPNDPNDPAQLVKHCEDAWPYVDWKQETFSDASAGGGTLELPNPLRKLRERLNSHCGMIHLSRIHADLNLSNLLVTTHQDQTPREVFVIDIATSESNCATALDFARLEVALWYEIFMTMAGPLTPGREMLWQHDFVAARDLIDGRRPDQPVWNIEQMPAFVKVVLALRHEAFLLLAPRDDKEKRHYLLGDYFHCLYFVFLSFLQFDGVRASPIRVRALILGAALTLCVLESAGNYNRHASPQYTRPWERPPFDFDEEAA